MKKLFGSHDAWRHLSLDSRHGTASGLKQLQGGIWPFHQLTVVSRPATRTQKQG